MSRTGTKKLRRILSLLMSCITPFPRRAPIGSGSRCGSSTAHRIIVPVFSEGKEFML